MYLPQEPMKEKLEPIYSEEIYKTKEEFEKEHEI